MKKITEWFKLLPPDIREKATTNAIKHGNAEEQDSSLEQAILGGFDWASSPEKAPYWWDVHNRASRGEFSNASDVSSNELIVGDIKTEQDMGLLLL